eukprot:CAMPEP_0181080104 /NCGR_PEP_ID=MMETSP1071-20121207/2389_1 /TAXON_ID=35127 /ORGANISM="Thalassiosira sp., Strain NH16" /LENGTH=92 /DNA_ID=CAMNT_0023161559 /DNA_START=409 /DNA_END=685 /DNA_ORIENTATION=+
MGKAVDEFNDVHIWVNRNTNESRYESPEQPLYPLTPKSMMDPETGKPLSPKTIRQNEADSSSSDEDSVNKQSTSQEESEGGDDTLMAKSEAE